MTFSFEFVLQGDCADERIVLPRQSPLGIAEGLDYQPMGMWPVIFVCTQHGSVFLRYPEEVALESVPDQLPRGNRLWQIECQCAHDNCVRMFDIYTTGFLSADSAEIVSRILRANPKIACNGHDLVLKEQRMAAHRWD